ncbi:MAG TPA: DoxX family protein [Cyclobacteriaceae bacterium]|nr:DoxX family protein [Cyclobacteriaceae bacterium]
MKTPTILTWVARVIAAVLLLQTLFFKFSGAAESVQLFTQLGVEPWGRIGTGVFELIASALILIPATAWLGSIMAIGLMTGAIFSHVFVIGILRNDGGLLFSYAVIIFACALFSFWMSRSQVPAPVRKFLPSFLK